jgi:hypothetical protein
MHLARANHCRLEEPVFFARTNELFQYLFRTIAVAFEYGKACCHSGDLPVPRAVTPGRDLAAFGGEIAV